MLHFSTLLLAFSVAGSVTAAPTQLNKRIAQVISDSTAKWVAACEAANGGSQCSSIAEPAFTALLAAGGNCDQQNNADIMMDLSKKLASSDMITLTQIFAQQPRNTPDSLSVPYCQQAPKNAELNGLFQCQFQGASLTNFVGGLAVGAPGTIPFGQSSPVNPPGGCPANPSGPITAGAQLNSIVSSPGVPSGSGASNASSNGNPSSAASSASSAATNASSASSVAVAPSSASLNNSSPAATPSVAASAGDFHAQNGQDAQALNQQFQSLTADSPCTGAEEACVNGQFAQCSGGKFVLSPCAGGLTCQALPLVNKPGTSVTCDSQADATARIAAALGSK